MTDSILHWNQVALDATKVDFSTADAKDNPRPQQGGPTRTSKALAMIHIAMYDAFVGATHDPMYLPGPFPALLGLNAQRVAVSSAACLTLTDLYSRQTTTFQEQHLSFVASLGATDMEVAAGKAWGTEVAARMRTERLNDNSNVASDVYAPSPMPGHHRLDPTDPEQGFLGTHWGTVAPFGIKNLNKVPTNPPPTMNSQTYADDYNEVKRLGVATNSDRTPDQTTIGIFWAYDGPRNIGVPPRLYNQVVRAISKANGATEAQNAKLFAVVNVAMADSGIQAWHQKYKENIWRPIIGIREADAGWGPTGLGDSNVATAGDPYWVPLGAPRTNQPARAPGTPNFPAYPSGHATFGTAALESAMQVLGLSPIFAFEFISDELDGKAVGETGIRAKHTRKLTIASAIQENVDSRVYLGVHWRSDSLEGERNGRFIAQHIAAVFPQKAMLP